MPKDVLDIEINTREHVVFIWDGKSKGTRNEILLAMKTQKPFNVYLNGAAYDFPKTTRAGE